MANDKFINEIADKLQNHGSEVNPQMWQAVSSQISAAGAGASGAAALGFGKVAAIIIGTTAVAVASYFAINSSEEKTVQNTEVAQVQKETSPLTKKETTNTEAKEETINANAVEAQPTEDTSPTIDENEIVQLPIMVEQAETPPSITRIEIPIVTEPVRTIPKLETPSNDNIGSTNPNGEPSKESPEVVSNDDANQNTAPNTSFGITKLPNVFSPNNDGANDYFLVESKGLLNYSIVVLDKENNKVWQTTSPNDKWDGRDLSGEIVPAGEYIYFVAAEGPNGEKIGKYQRLTITK